MSTALQKTDTPREWKMAQSLAKSSLIPKHFQGKVEDCFILLSIAASTGLNFLEVAQNLYIVHGLPSWSGKFCKALIDRATLPNGQTRYMGVHYEYQRGDKDVMLGCRLVATDRETGMLIEGTWVTWDTVKGEGWDQAKGSAKSKWLTMREQMFHYRAAAWFMKAHCPGAGSGLSAAEEIEDAEEVITAAPVRAEQLPPAPAIDWLKRIADVTTIDELRAMRDPSFNEEEKQAWLDKGKALKAAAEGK